MIAIPNTSRGNTVQVSDRATAGAAGHYYSVNGQRVYINAGHRCRIRKAGTITQAKVYLNAIGDLTSIKIGVYRPLATAGHFEYIGESDAIAVGSLQVGLNTIGGLSLSCQVGDCLSLRLNATGVGAWVKNNTGNDNQDYDLYYEEGNLNAADNTFAGNISGASIELYGYSTSPIWVSIGDSFMEGATTCRSFAHPLPGAEDWLDDIVPGENIMSYLAARDSVLFDGMNHAKGGTDAGAWVGIIDSCVEAYYPRACLISLGYNEISTATSYSTYEANLRDIVQNLLINDIVPVFIDILHNHSGTALQKKTVRFWNSRLHQWCKDRGILCVPANRILSGDNYDQRDETLFGSATHPNADGYAAIAAAINGHVIGY